MGRMSDFNQILLRFVDSVYPSKDSLLEKLGRGDKLRIYHGIDPTSPRIHVGNAVSLQLLKKFQDEGHKVILVFGDFTGLIGDPSGRDTQRSPLTKKQVGDNCASYKEQVRKILDFSNNPPEIVYNSSWWKKMKSAEFFQILSHFTLAQLMERDLFERRIEKDQPIALSEFLYPILQGYDSVALDTDAELGATDQTFNMLIGREMLKIFKRKEKFVLTTPLLEGPDGAKMSKSYGNTIDITALPDDMFGKLMSIKDNLMEKYFTLTTDLDREEVKDTLAKSKPIDAKKRLAYEVVKIYHGETAAKKAQSGFERAFQKREGAAQIITIHQPRSILPLSYASLTTKVGITSSISEAVRLAENKGLKFNGEIVKKPRNKLSREVGAETIIDIGKRKSVKIIWGQK